MQKKNQAWIWVGAVIVVVIVVFALVWKPGSATPEGPAPMRAPAGQIVAGFPQQLVLDSSAQVNNSYSLNNECDGGCHRDDRHRGERFAGDDNVCPAII